MEEKSYENALPSSQKAVGIGGGRENSGHNAPVGPPQLQHPLKDKHYADLDEAHLSHPEKRRRYSYL